MENTIDTPSLISYIKDNVKNVDVEFVNQFAHTLDKDGDECCISLNDIYNKWLGIDRIDNAKKQLKLKSNGLVENIDYKILNIDDLISLTFQGNSVGRPKEQIMLTIDTFKKLSMKANNEHGAKVRNYYIEMEKWFKRYLLSQINKQAVIDVTQQAQVVEERALVVRNDNNEVAVIEQITPVILELIDINEYRGCNVVYLYHIEDNDYKFGITDDIIRRNKEHWTYFKKFNCDVKLMRLWKCDGSHKMAEIEDMIKVLARQNNIIRNKYEMTEIIEIVNINDIIEKIDRYVKDNITYSDRVFEMRMKELEIQKISIEKDKLKIEKKKLAIEKEKLSIEKDKFDAESEKIRLEIEKFKLMSSFQQIQPVAQLQIAAPQVTLKIEEVTPKPNEVSDTVINKNSIISNWIKENPPGEIESVTKYCTRFSETKLYKMQQKDFNKIVKDNGYDIKKTTKCQVWIRTL